MELMRNVSVSCRGCKKREKYPQTDMHVEMVGKTSLTRIYWHFECWKEQEKKEKEMDDFVELMEVIKEIYSMTFIPLAFHVILQDLHKGIVKIKNYNGRKRMFKNGVPYHIIKEAYLMSKNDIRWSLNNKVFKHDMARLNYGLRIVESNINNAERKLKNVEQQENMYVNPDHSYSDYKVEPLKKFPRS